MKLLAMVLALTLAACGAQPGTHGGLNTGNGLTTAALQLGVAAPTTATPTESSTEQGLTAQPVATDAQGTAFTFSSLTASVRRIDMELPGPESFSDAQKAGISPGVSLGADEVTIAGPFEVDLITQSSDPSLTAIVLPSGTYSRVRVRIDSTAGRHGEHAIEAAGSFNYKGMRTGLAFDLDFNEDALFTNAGGFQLQGNQVTLVNLHFDVSKWFTQLPITACLDDGDLTVDRGTVHLDDGQGACGNLQDRLKNAIEASGAVSTGP